MKLLDEVSADTNGTAKSLNGGAKMVFFVAETWAGTAKLQIRPLGITGALTTSDGWYDWETATDDKVAKVDFPPVGCEVRGVLTGSGGGASQVSVILL